MSERKSLPMQYHVEFYSNTMKSDPIYYMQSSTPPIAFNVGDLVEPHTWELNELPPNKIYKVAQVTHLIWRIESSHWSQKLLVVLSTIDREK